MLRILSALAALAKTTSTQSVTAGIPPSVMQSTTASTVTTASVATTGNGAPSGPHYNLNIIGVPKDKTAAMTAGDGHRIFVQLQGGEDAVSLNGKLSNQLLKVNKIFLQPRPRAKASKYSMRTRPTPTEHSSNFPPTSRRTGRSGAAPSVHLAERRT